MAMTGPCTSEAARYRNGEHRWEYHETRNGEEWERCADCGESHFLRYHDVGSGG